MRMRAIVIDDYGSPDLLRLAERPAPAAGPGEIRVRVEAAGVNPADVKWRAGMFRDRMPLSFPYIPGYDIAGVVDGIGAGATGFAIGDTVVAMLDPMTKGGGGYAACATVDTAAATHRPSGLSSEVAAALPTPALTGFQLIELHVQPKPGDTILITGATGAVGRFATHAALAAGAHVIAAVRETHRDEALRIGAHQVVIVDGRTPPPVVDHVADTVGGPDIAHLCRGLKPGGRIRTVATTPIDPAGLADSPQMIGVHPDGAMLARIVALVADGTIAVPIDRLLPLAEAATAHRLVEAGGLSGKVILQP